MFHSETGVTDQNNSFGAKHFTLKPISLLLITVLYHIPLEEGIDKAKLNKAHNMLNILCCLFQKCFQYGIAPSVWNKSIIKPMPKSAKVNSRVYKCIQVFSIIALLLCPFSSNSKKVPAWVNVTRGMFNNQNVVRNQKNPNY